MVLESLRKLFRPYSIVFTYLFKRPHTIKYPYERLEFSPRYRGLHTLDLEKCTSCGLCRMVCPNEAIELVPLEEGGKGHVQIDYGRCSFCGYCIEFCRLSALKMTDIVEISTDNSRDIIWSPRRLTEKPSIRDVLPEMKRVIRVEIKGESIGYREREKE